jgi:hypothetical protein
VRSEVLIVALLKTQVFWDVIPCHWASSSPYLEGLQCLHLQGQAVQEVLYPENEGTMIVLNVGNYSIHTVSHTRRVESSSTEFFDSVHHLTNKNKI